MAKKKDLPAMPFYFGDWRKAPEIRALDLADRMIWFEMLGFMWESTERGFLTLNSKPIDTPMLARMLGLTEERLTLCLTILETLEVFSRREADGAIYNRKMVRDEEIRVSRANGGILGGNPLLTGKKPKKKVNLNGYPLVEPSPENETEDVGKYNNDSHYSADDVKRILTTDQEFFESAVKVIAAADFKAYAKHKIGIWEPSGFLTKYALGTIKRIFLEDYPKWKKDKPVQSGKKLEILK